MFHACFLQLMNSQYQLTMFKTSYFIIITCITLWSLNRFLFVYFSIILNRNHQAKGYLLLSFASDQHRHCINLIFKAHALFMILTVLCEITPSQLSSKVNLLNSQRQLFLKFIAGNFNLHRLLLFIPMLSSNVKDM